MAKDKKPLKSKTPKAPATKTSKPRRTSSKKTPYKIWHIALMGLIWSFFVGCLALVWFSYDLPDVRSMLQETRRPSIVILARDGSQINTYGDFYGKSVASSKLPKHITQAFIATEDRRFYQHFGIDVLGILRAGVKNSMAGSVVQGGSTISQQLAKNFLLSKKLYTYQDRSLRRKVQEVLMALWLEHKFTKAQILTLYLNRTYFGAGAFGLEAASQKYFFKPASKLNLYEASVLAGLLKAPSKYSPSANPKLAHQRAGQVLGAMQAAGFIVQNQRDQAFKGGASLNRVHQGSMMGRYFIDWVVDLIPERVGYVDEDLVVVTTLDPKLQRLAEKEVKDIMAKDAPALNVSQVALVSLSSSGAVRAMVGGKDYVETQFNRAVQAQRQTGSAFKFFLYLTALENGYRPQTMVEDGPIRFGSWAPRNFNWQTRGELSLQDAFARSVNTVSARLVHVLGVSKVQETAKRLGITSPQPKDLTIALGSGEASLLEMVGAFTTCANQGYEVKPYGIVEIKTNRGRVLYAHPGQSLVTKISAQNLDHMRTLLSAVMDYGTGRSAKVSGTCWGKTGTTQSHKDAWFIGSTDRLTTGVWMGNDDNKPTKDVTGGKLPGKLWHALMAHG